MNIYTSNRIVNASLRLQKSIILSQYRQLQKTAEAITFYRKLYNCAVHMNAIKRFLRKRTGCIKFATLQNASPRSQHPLFQSYPFVLSKTRRHVTFRVRVIARNNAVDEMVLNDFG